MSEAKVPGDVDAMTWLRSVGGRLTLALDGGAPVTFDLFKLLDADSRKITEQLSEQAQLLGAFGQLAEAARTKEVAAKRNRDQVEALEARTFREAEAAAGRKVTEKAVEEGVERSPAVAGARLAHANAGETVRRVEAVVEALRERGYNLRKLAELALGEHAAPGAVRAPGQWPGRPAV